MDAVSDPRRGRTHPWTCTPIASQVKTNTSPGRPRAVGIRQPRNSPPIANNNSDAHERDGPKVDNDILHPHSVPRPCQRQRRSAAGRRPSSTTDTWRPPAPPLSSPSATGSGARIEPFRRQNSLTLCSPNRTKPQGALSLVHPQPLRQIVKRHHHKRIIAPHQRRLAHPGPYRPTLTML